MTSCSLEGSSHCFGGTYSLYLEVCRRTHHFTLHIGTHIPDCTATLRTFENDKIKNYRSSSSNSGGGGGGRSGSSSVNGGGSSGGCASSSSSSSNHEAMIDKICPVIFWDIHCPSQLWLYVCKQVFMPDMCVCRIVHPVSNIKSFWTKHIFYGMWLSAPTQNPRPGTAGYPILSGLSLLTCLTWETLPVATLPSGSFDHTTPTTTLKYCYLRRGVNSKLT